MMKPSMVMVELIGSLVVTGHGSLVVSAHPETWGNEKTHELELHSPWAFCPGWFDDCQKWCCQKTCGESNITIVYRLVCEPPFCFIVRVYQCLSSSKRIFFKWWRQLPGKPPQKHRSKVSRCALCPQRSWQCFFDDPRIWSFWSLCGVHHVRTNRYHG